MWHGSCHLKSSDEMSNAGEQAAFHFDRCDQAQQNGVWHMTESERKGCIPSQEGNASDGASLLLAHKQ